ncbi:hypothetical protein RSOLAG1IB_00893 [Rhizoctonia solani AG-1 IB]|uniref:Uncharacterized protein n=1 Tax=Thanatephorus cucumeris (strain AG1-IB / isolate 7/3/14) TaxID=1108050 RepID=A0A0B7F809_THACB|nr:hypothetical protein RSOLAG1IB_00893 [Rhizoctonia solani AG-1 IB]
MSGLCHVSRCLQTRISAMNVTDIMSSRPFGGRKRSWGEDHCEPPKKRTPYTWIRERPPVAEIDYPIIRQVQSIALGTRTDQNDIQMIIDEPARAIPLPSSAISRSASPPLARNTLTITPPETPVQPTATARSPDSLRPLEPTRTGSNTKKRFAIGPRADCEKCLAREPGHYGHWL